MASDLIDIWVKRAGLVTRDEYYVVKLVKKTFSNSGLSQWVQRQNVTHRRGKENESPPIPSDRSKRESTSKSTSVAQEGKGPRNQKGRTHRKPTAKGIGFKECTKESLRTLAHANPHAKARALQLLVACGTCY